jgi:hypothetical protein
MLFYSVMALASIVTETNAEKPTLPPPVSLACTGSRNHVVAPFLDSEGEPRAKRIKLRMSLEHEDLKTGAASK